MKKLVIAAVIVCAAALSQAATVTWTYTAGSLFDGTDSGGKVTPNTAVYLVQTSAKSTTDIVTAFAQATSLSTFEDTVAGWAADTGSVNSSWKINVLDQTTSKLTAGTGENAYFVIFYSGKMFVSNAIGAQFSSPGGNDTYTFSYTTSMSAQLRALPKDASAGYDGTGWYTQAVPEPTSGLLLLLGVAGMALRRRRA